MESPEKFDILHQRNLWKAADLGKNAAPAKYSVITAPHSEQDTCVMRKAVCQAINRRVRRQADSEKTAGHTRIDHNASDFIKTSPRHFCIRMEKPEKIAARRGGTGVHLDGSPMFTQDHLVTEARGEIRSVIPASSVRDHDFRFRSALAQMSQKWLQPQSFIKNGNNNRNPHARRILTTPGNVRGHKISCLHFLEYVLVRVIESSHAKAVFAKMNAPWIILAAFRAPRR